MTRSTRSRGLFRLAIALALAAVIGGAVIAYRSYAATAGPDGAVKGYFDALRRDDASAALGFGTLPSSGIGLVTAAVLREQQHIAPIRNFAVTSTDRRGSQATVHVRYQLGFADGPRDITDTLAVTRRKGSWRLVTSAVAITLALDQASQRATILGRSVPQQPVLMFPGAVPIRFDTPYLALSAQTSSIEFSGGGQTPLTVEATDQAHRAVVTALAKALPPCLAGPPSSSAVCPLPTPRAVPGSLKAMITGQLAAVTQVNVSADPAGVLNISSQLNVTGTYQELNFDDVAVTHTGPVVLPVVAHAYAVTPITITWTLS